MKASFMKKVSSFVLGLFAGLLLLLGTAHAQSSSAGKEFYFAFPPNYASNGTLSLFITGERDTQGTVDVAGLNFTTPFVVKANKVTTVALPAAAQALAVDATSRSTVHVLSQDNVTVYGLNQQQYTTDALLALPVDALGVDYMALSYVNNIGFPSQLAITGAFDGTQVTVTPAAQLNNHPVGVPFTVTLQKGETYFLTSNTDVSGSSVSASAPIAVVAGVECVNIPTGVPYCDHIVEMMTPVSTWGRSFLTVPLATRLNGDVFRILAAENGTRITIGGVLVATLQRGKFYEGVLKVRSQIEASAPVLVAQYSPGTSFDGVTSDPFMMLIPPNEQFLSQYTFSTPATGFPLNFVNVVVPSGAINAVQLDGTAISPALFGSIGTSGFSGAQVPIALGDHTLVITSGVPFGIHVYGFGSFDSYGYPGGMSFAAINPVGDPYLPNMRLVEVGGTLQGLATDSEDTDANGVLSASEDLNHDSKIGPRSEDINGNGKLDPGEDTNGNGILDRDTGIFKIEFLAGATNLKLDVLPFIPGSLAVPFSISRVDVTKPGTGVLRIQDGAGNKIESPIALGGVAILQNVRVIETISTAGLDLDLASFQKQPFSITDGVGQKIVEWRFDTFNANAVADLSFDVVFKNPIPGENRLVSYKLELLYNDVNGKPVRTELGSRFVDVYPSSLTIAPSTNKPSYGAGETVLISDLVKNLSAFTGTVGVKLSIQDTQQRLVAALGTLPAQTVAAGAANTFSGLNFNVANTLSGNYRVVAELLDAGNKTIAIGAAPFVIFTAGGAQVQSTITTDKRIYAPLNNVQVADRITNVLTNSALDDLRVTTTVNNPDGTLRFSRIETLVQLLAGATRDYGYTLPLVAAAAGQYNAVLSVTKADGTQLSRSTTQFTVSSTADTGAGLTGRISATPKLVNDGQTVVLDFSAINNGNSAVANLPLTVRIVDPDKQVLVKEYPYNASLAVGAAFSQTASWVAKVSAGANYVAVLEATVGGKSQVLASAPFTVLKLGIAQTLFSPARVLALASCKNRDEGDKEKDDDERASGKLEDEHDEDQDKSKTCVADRATTIKRALTALGVSHTVVTNTTEFKRAFRSGLYNTYWISGKQYKLQDELASEIREAVFGGDRLILDGVHDERNKVLDTITGIAYRGKLEDKGLLVNTTGSLFAAQHLPVVGNGLKLVPDGGEAAATFEGKGARAMGPAIFTHSYGQGRSILFGFDFVSSLRAQALWQPVLQSSLQYLRPVQTTTLTPGALLPVKTSIANQGQATGVQVKIALPTAATVLGSNPTATTDAATNTVSWAFDLAAQQSSDLFLTVRVPPAAGDYALQTRVSTVNSGTANPYGSPLPLNFRVVAAAQSYLDARAALLALPLTSKKDQKLREKLLEDLAEVLAKFKLNTATGYEDAIEKLAKLVDGLSGLLPTDTVAVRLGLDRILKEAEWRWSLLPAASEHH